MSINIFLQVLALVFLVLAALKTPEPAKLSFGWAGMALWMLTIIFGGLRF
jgi:steroid 5-alpha reductase family enzyme